MMACDGYDLCSNFGRTNIYQQEISAVSVVFGLTCHGSQGLHPCVGASFSYIRTHICVYIYIYIYISQAALEYEYIYIYILLYTHI